MKQPKKESDYKGNRLMIAKVFAAGIQARNIGRSLRAGDEVATVQAAIDKRAKRAAKYLANFNKQLDKLT